MKKIVSIIIPIYNAKNYIEDCINSVISQSYLDIEIILVDDGSTDGSSLICDEFAQKDTRIKVYHKANGGVSSARNLGLVNSTGEFVCFVDADDYVEKDYIKTLIENIGDFDCAAIGLQIVDKKTEKAVEIIIHSDAEYNNKETFLENYCKDYLLRAIFFGPYCKLYKKNLIQQISFDETMLSGEDIVFNLNYLTISSSVKIVEYIGYTVMKHDNSATNNSAQCYSVRSEHGYNLIRDKIREARKKMGVSNAWLDNAERTGAPLLFIKEIINLVSYNSPYSRKEVLRKVREIHNDTLFIKQIKDNKYRNLSNSGKIAKLCAFLNCPILTILICKICFKKYYIAKKRY